jgi:hypothetical protein
VTERARRLLAPLALVAAAVIGCAELTSVPSGVSALDFTGIPFPAVVTGDTLRDVAGISAPLRATAYDGRGAVITDADIQYVALDTGVTIDANGFLIATRRDGTVRVVASVAGLQSQARQIVVTRAPDSVVAPTTDVALEYRVPDAAANVSPALALSLRSNDTTGAVSPNVAGWLVRWRIIHAGDTLATTDTSTVALWAPSGNRHTLTDTTKADGTSSRRLRVYSNLLPLQPDSFIVVAEIRSRGVQVPGSPVRYVVTITPPTI